jgi:hypothetical protein
VGLMLAGLCAEGARAQAPAPERKVDESNFLHDFDIEALKAGDWVEYENKLCDRTFKSKWACVKVEGDTAFIEETFGGRFTLYAVSRIYGKITRAWDKNGKELEIVVIAVEGPRPGDPTIAYKGTGAVFASPLTVNGTALRCERTDVKYGFKFSDPKWGGMDPAEDSSEWLSAEVSFRKPTDDRDFETQLTWSGKRTVRGGRVKYQNLWNPKCEHRVDLIGWGTDAKPTISK